MKKKIERKINKIIILFFAFSVFSLYGIPKNFRVEIFVPNKDSIDLSKYKKIVFQQYDFNLPEIEIEYKKIFENFFFIEFQKAIGNKVDFINKKLISIKIMDTDPKKMSRLILDEYIKTNYIDSLFISIEMTLKMDKRHVISEKKDKYGDVEKSFKKKIVWSLKTNIGLVDINSGKIVKKLIINKKISEEKRSSEQFNFKYLFDATMSEFIRKLMKKGHFEKRYLLSQLWKTINPSIMRKS